MHVAARRSLRFASKEPATFIVGRRRSSPRSLRSLPSTSARPFSLFPWGNSTNPPNKAGLPVAVWNNEKQHWESVIGAESLHPAKEVATQLTEDAGGGGEPPASSAGNGAGEKDKNAPYGSALRRSMRNRKPKEAMTVDIPFDFLSWSVRRHKFDGALTKGVLHITGAEEDGLDKASKAMNTGTTPDVDLSHSKPNSSSSGVAKAGKYPVADTTKGVEQSSIESSAGQAHVAAQDATSSMENLGSDGAQYSIDHDAILVKFYASLQECSQAYVQMEETYGPPGDKLQNWENLPDKWSEMPNLVTEYERLAAEFEDIAHQAFTAFPNGELARKLSSEPELGKDFAQHVDALESVLRDFAEQTNTVALSPSSKSTTQPEPRSTEYFPQYSLNNSLFSEVLASISAGLSPQSTGNLEFFAGQKSHLKLLCPIDGGIYFLDKVVEEAATKLGADVMILDPQDLAEMAAGHIREGENSAGNALWTLGFDAAQVYNEPTSSGRSDEEEAEGEDGYEEDMEREQGFSPKIGAVTAIPLSAAPREMQNVIKKFFSGSGDASFTSMSSQNTNEGGPNFPFPIQSQKPSAAQTNDNKLNVLLEAVVGANLFKRDYLTAERRKLLRPIQSACAAQGVGVGSQRPGSNASSTISGHGETTTTVIPLSGIQQSPTEKQVVHTPPTTPKTVVVLRDFKEMRSTQQGAKVVGKIIDIVAKKRQSGQQIMLVGTSSSADLAKNVSFNALESLQGEDDYTVFRTLVVTPDTHRGLYYQEERRRLREINGRHLAWIMSRLDPVRQSEYEKKQGSRAFVAQLLRELEGTPHAAHLEEQILPFDDVHRIMFTAMGQRNLDPETKSFTRVTPKHIASALDLIKKSDELKSSWAQEEYQIQNPPVESDRKESPSSESRLKKLRKTCNAREKTLLRGVVNPENIQTTFSDVHAPSETIEILKNLTTLSLTRPEAFKYGVLAKDKLSGLLLYGPPGTGKTLLAKAVAKQSGATMLEVSGSDVYDMYVGEGEKNVRAVFSLAKKLAPCVIFIDEADAIFASRGSSTNRNSHRELINQFLREWDGMNETSAFLMVATNRPFDLDDAALRRLPRRILIDLPSDKDREAILAIHLKDEILDSSVSLAKLAAQTPLYSGSDLKNLAVATALAAVREENDEASKHTGEEEYKFPEKRTLSMHHFEKAMEEISASVSEDMSSLGAIRKFDEKYGDRRGRRKKPTYGFANAGVAKEETAKVRT